MRRGYVLVALALASASMSVLLAVAVNVATGGELPGPLAPLEPFAWPAVALSAFITAVLAFWQQQAPEMPGSAPTEPTEASRLPAELPAMASRFTGRAEEVRVIAEAVEAGAPVIAVSGPAGVGKSALVLQIAHGLRDQYPDGALFVRLRGASPNPATPADVLGRFLTTLKADAPPGEAERHGDYETLAAQFRTLVAGRRFLILLDDAADAAQVRPLLPGTAGSLVLVTSRPVLAELNRATLVRLGVFSADEARELLTLVAGAERVEADPAATDAVLRACGNLPLAVGIAGSRLRARPSWTMATLAGRLADESRRLDELRVGHDAVRTSVAASYVELDPHHQRVFRRLGAHPGTDFDAPAAAALADLVASGAAPALDSLVDRQLVEVVTAERYRLHDLLRLFAVEQLRPAAGSPSGEGEPAALGPEGVAALGRLARHYTAGLTTGLVDAERENIVATVLAAAAAGLDEEAWRLAAAAEAGFSHYPYHSEGSRLWTAGLAAARATGQPAWIARAEYALARAAEYGGDVRLGLAHARQSLVWWQRTGDRLNTAAAHRRLASALHAAGRLAEAEDHYGRTLQLCAETDSGVAPDQTMVALRASTLRGLGVLQLARLNSDAAIRSLQLAVDAQQAAGDEAGLAKARTALARVHRKAGRTAVGREMLEPQLAVFRRLGDVMWEVTALRELGRLDLAEGHLAAAADRLEAARALAERTRNQTGAGITLTALAEVEIAAGRPGAAATRYRQAVAVFQTVEGHVREGITLLRLAILLAHEGQQAGADACVERADSVLVDVDLPEVARLRGLLERSTPTPAEADLLGSDAAVDQP